MFQLSASLPWSELACRKVARLELPPPPAQLPYLDLWIYPLLLLVLPLDLQPPGRRAWLVTSYHLMWGIFLTNHSYHHLWGTSLTNRSYHHLWELL